MARAFTWIPESELELINKLKGDISLSLFIKRAIRKVLKEEFNVQVGNDVVSSQQLPQPATPTPEVRPTNRSPTITNTISNGGLNES
jgi:hypothetical protein